MHGTLRRFNNFSPATADHGGIIKECHIGETTDKMKGAANKAAGSVKAGVGDATDDHRLEAEGHAQKAKGDAQDAKGEAKGTLKDAVDKL